MPESRRHRLIWSAVGCLHLAAFGAVWLGGSVGLGEPAREGGLVVVALLPEPVALPGEAKGGASLGAGLPIAIATNISAAPAVAPAPMARPAWPASASNPEPTVATKGEALAAAPAPVAEVFVPPAFRFRQEPAYPERARRAGVEGVVGMRIVLAADGTVRAVELTRSSGSRLLDEAAETAARASTFTPASRNHAPVASEAEASYRFELR